MHQHNFINAKGDIATGQLSISKLLAPSWTSVSQYYYHNPIEKQRCRAVPLYQQSVARRPDLCLIAVVIAYIITGKLSWQMKLQYGRDSEVVNKNVKTNK